MQCRSLKYWAFSGRVDRDPGPVASRERERHSLGMYIALRANQLKDDDDDNRTIGYDTHWRLVGAAA